MFRVPGVGRYFIHGGNVIEVEPDPGADPDAVELLARNAARGALIHQRRELPLEGCAMLTPGGLCVVLCGSSAGGKSSLAAALSGRGWRLLTDGITRVTLDAGRALAWPSADAVKVWRDACQRLGIDTRALKRVRKGADRYFLALPSVREVAQPLSAIIKLGIASQMSFDEPRLEESERRDFIAEHVFKPRHAALLGHPGSFEPIVANLARTTRLYVLKGARSRPASELADAIARALS